MIYFTALTFNCVCRCIRPMFRVLGMYNFDFSAEKVPLSQPYAKGIRSNETEHAMSHMDIKQISKSF